MRWWGLLFMRRTPHSHMLPFKYQRSSIFPGMHQSLLIVHLSVCVNVNVWMWARTDFSGDLHCQFPTSRLRIIKGNLPRGLFSGWKKECYRSRSYVLTSVLQTITFCIHDFFTAASCSFSLTHLSSSLFQLLFRMSSSILLLSLFCFIHVDDKIISCLSFNMESIKRQYNSNSSAMLLLTLNVHPALFYVFVLTLYKHITTPTGHLSPTYYCHCHIMWKGMSSGMNVELWMFQIGAACLNREINSGDS